LKFPEVKEMLKRETQRVLNFYLGRTGKAIEEAVLISPVFNYEIVKLASEELKLKIRNLSIAELPKLQPSWFPVLGTALRGLVSRSRDTDISLSAIGSQAEYYHERAISFIALWRNILIGTFVLILTVFVTIDTVFSREQKQLETRITNDFNTAVLKNSGEVQGKITAFNKLVTMIDETSKKETLWSPLLIQVHDIAGKDISLTELKMTNGDQVMTVRGNGVSDQAILAFKDRLIKAGVASSINLPLAAIIPNTDTGASFSFNAIMKKTMTP
jgi:hypothetical protein